MEQFLWIVTLFIIFEQIEALINVNPQCVVTVFDTHHIRWFIVDGCERDENNLASVTELLIDALMDSQDDSTRKSIWRSIVESGQVRFTIWKQVRLIGYKYSIRSPVY